MSELKIKNLTVEVKDKIVAKDISFSIASGEVHLLMGLNGSGKSSLLNAVMGHPNYKISGGEVVLNNKVITGIKPDEKAKREIFLSMQYIPEISGVTVSDFFHQMYKILKDRTISVFDSYQILEKRTEELGIDSRLLKRDLNVGFSGGEKKQMELLQLAVLEPKFALLDEIDSGVDANSVKKIFRGIKNLSNKGTGFLLVTHYNTILNYITPSFVYIMNEGKIIRSGGPELVSEIIE